MVDLIKTNITNLDKLQTNIMLPSWDLRSEKYRKAQVSCAGKASVSRLEGV